MAPLSEAKVLRFRPGARVWRPDVYTFTYDDVLTCEAAVPAWSRGVANSAPRGRRGRCRRLALGPRVCYEWASRLAHGRGPSGDKVSLHPGTQRNMAGERRGKLERTSWGAIALCVAGRGAPVAGRSVLR